MNTRTFDVDGKVVLFVNEYGNTPTGFSHTSNLFINGVFYNKGKCKYINRTWESYPYRGSMMCAVSNEITARTSLLKSNYKMNNNISRMTKKHNEKLDEIITNDSQLKLLNTIMYKL